MTMKHFKNAAGQVFAFEADGSQDEFIPADLIAISDEEADHLRAALFAPSPESARAERDALIVAAGFEVNRIEDNGGDASAWRKYRQALRDWPSTSGFPDLATLPAAPR